MQRVGVAATIGAVRPVRSVGLTRVLSCGLSKWFPLLALSSDLHRQDVGALIAITWRRICLSRMSLRPCQASVNSELPLGRHAVEHTRCVLV